jgi:ubiquinone/menaquinone biosynthesis C-methylase UbiE
MVKESWFDSLTMIGLRDHHLWLANLPIEVKCIANFGCMSGSEPFALLWVLDAQEVTVVDIDEKFLRKGREQKEIITIRCPESLQNRVVNFVCGDMTELLSEIPDQYFDLAYCKDVLYILKLQGGTGSVERGISQMIRVVKPNGLIVAVESKYDAKFETQKVLGVDMPIPVRLSEPKDMSPLFESKGLKKLEIQNRPQYTYCYQRNGV